jgi:hypothetical protein
MAFDSPTRKRLQRMVDACRSLLTAEFEEQLQERFGIYPAEGRVLAIEKLPQRDDQTLAIAQLLRRRIEYLSAQERVADSKEFFADAVQRVLREQAFSVLNRFAALRMAEERGFIPETIGGGFSSKGALVYTDLAGIGLGGSYDRYRVFLDRMFDELSLDLGALFDRFSSYSLLFPRETALRALFDELNSAEIRRLWKEDETIGWIYQYYNDEAERKKMREDSSAPRNSRELAVRNQFFTPRYVVEFLTDNTLGRLWYEMRRGDTALRDRCRYLVRRPAEIFLNAGEIAPNNTVGSEALAGENLSQEELLRQPVHIPNRPLKDPREIRLLDPACGSMHFGLYAFDLFEVIYDEAWELEEKFGADASIRPAETKSLHGTFPDKAAFLREVPRLIVEHNIHGIDIDPRAVQIAGLSLWLRAQRAWHQAGVKPADRPRITRSNIVCAEPMPGEKELLREFVEQQFPTGEQPAFAFLLERIFDRMTLAGEAGSLLRIEEEIRTDIAEYKRLWKEGPKHEQATLFPEAGARLAQGEMSLGLSGITDEQFWERAEQRIYDALEAYAAQAENGSGFQRRLFAADAAQGFAFIDLCRKRYDVAVMNPPFGDSTEEVADLLLKWFPIAKKNTYIASILIGEERLGNGGMLGAITDATFIHQTRYEEFRAYLLDRNDRSFTCLSANGWGVLDSFVETAAFVLSKRLVEGALFVDLRDSGDVRNEVLLDLVHALQTGAVTPSSKFLHTSSFQRLPKSVLTFWLPTQILDAYRKFAAIDPSLIDARCGVSSSDNPRFYKLRWEVPVEQIGRSKKWVFLSNGGPPAPLFRQQVYVINYERDGYEIKTRVRALFGSESRTVINQQYYFRAGFTYGKRTESFTVQFLPSGHVFSNEGQAIFPVDQSRIWTTLAYLNTAFVASLLNSIAGQHKEAGYVGSLPAPPAEFLEASWISDCARENYRLLSAQATAIPEAQSFVWPLTGLDRTSNHFLRDAVAIVTRASDEFSKRFMQIDRFLESTLGFNQSEPAPWSRRNWNVASLLFEVSEDELAATVLHDVLGYMVGSLYGRWDIRYATGEQPAPELPDPFAPVPVCPPGMLQGDDGLPLSPETGRQLRAKGRYPLDVAWDGILVDDPEHPLDLECRVHAALEVLWQDRADDIEHEACSLLGVAGLREWFRRPAGFFAAHLRRYSKSRRQAPIYWPISTASGRYTLWIYYHRLTEQTLFKCVNEFVKPKISEVEADLTRLRANDGGRTEIDALSEFLAELVEFRDELLRITALPYKPNLNDGVLITACPLSKLFRLPKWQKDLKACWEKLASGDYDWAHIAYSIWPNRVRDACKADRSIAIAHGLEDLCEVALQRRRARRKSDSSEVVDIPADEAL